MAYLIDGNNFLGLRPEVEGKEPGARERLVQLVARLARAKRTRAIIVFDGEPGEGHGSAGGSGPRLGGVSVIYSGRSSDADTRILRILDQEADPAGFTLVTNDRSLGDRARHRRAKVLRNAGFQNLLAEAAASASGDEKPLSPDQIAEWEAWFKSGGDQGGA